MTIAQHRSAFDFAICGVAQSLNVLTQAFARCVIGGVLLIGGCANSPSPSLNLNDGSTSSIAQKPAATDCSHRIGRMQVRILQIRDYQPGTKTSDLSRSLQKFTTGLFGGTKRGLNPDAQHTRDVTALKEENAALKADGCKSFDVDAELNNTDARHTPAAR